MITAISHFTKSSDPALRDQLTHLFETIPLFSLEDHTFSPDWHQYSVPDAVPGVCFWDWSPDEASHPEQLEAFREEFPFLPTVVLVPRGNREAVVQAMQAGATDYLVKDSLHPQIVEKTLRLCLKYHQAKVAYREQRKNFARLFRNSHDAILLVDQEGTINHVNPSFLANFGAEVEEVEGKNLTEIFSGKPNSLEAIKSSLEDAPNVRVRIKTQKDREAICILALTPLGGEQGYQIILHEITRFLQARDRAKRAERLALTGRMARGLAHEVRNPLANISLAAHQLRETGPATGDTKLYLDIVDRNVKRISQLIDGILDSSTGGDQHPQKVDANQILQEAFSQCKDRITLKDIPTRWNLANQELYVYVDPDRLRMALVNLILNAVEAMEAVPEPQLSLSTRKNQELIEIEITDRGIGMTEEVKEQIFEPFFTTKKSGLGLGMMTLQNLVQHTEGTLTVNSQPGEGTTFILGLPATR